jgi:hypothetical protein
MTDEQMKAAVKLARDHIILCGALEHEGIPLNASQREQRNVSRALLACSTRLAAAEEVVRKAREFEAAYLEGDGWMDAVARLSQALAATAAEGRQGE